LVIGEEREMCGGYYVVGTCEGNSNVVVSINLIVFLIASFTAIILIRSEALEISQTLVE
jgi:hypothetical protein